MLLTGYLVSILINIIGRSRFKVNVLSCVLFTETFLPMIDLRADVYYGNMTKLLFCILCIVFYINLVNCSNSEHNFSISEDLCPNTKSDVLSRRRRALSFPDGSNFIVRYPTDYVI